MSHASGACSGVLVGVLRPAAIALLALFAHSAGGAAVGEAGGSGAWPAAAQAVPGLPGHTVYRPVGLPTSPMPLYVWGNGGCSANGLAHAAYLREIASHGYLVIALGAPGASPRSAAGAAPAGGNPPDATQPQQLIEAIDWATRENQREGSELRGRVDTSRIAAGGHSCGGLQALAISHDPRVATTLVLNSGIYIRPGGRSGVQIDKSQLTRLRGPLLYLSGGPSDIAHENALDDVARLETAPVFFGALGVGHGGTFQAPNGGEWASVSLRWLDWQLKADAEAGRDFSGPSCRLCTDARWEVQQKRLPAPGATGNRAGQ